MSTTTYSVIARNPNSWSASTGIHEITWECGHKHRAYAAADACMARNMGTSRDGSYPAYMHHARVESSRGDIMIHGDPVANVAEAR